MWRRFLSLISITRPTTWVGLVVVTLALVCGLAADIMAMFFNTTLVGGFGILLILGFISLMLAAAIAAEAAYKFNGKDPPSWLPKALRIVLGIFLAASFSWFMFQSWMAWGHSIHAANRVIWVVMGDIIIVVLLVGCGFAAKALGQTFGKEFLPSVVAFLVAWGLVMATTYTSESMIDDVFADQMYVAYNNATCDPKVGEPSFHTEWDLRSRRAGLFAKTLWTSKGCEAFVLKWDNPTDQDVVRKAIQFEEENRMKVVLQNTIWGAAIFAGLFVLAVVAVIGWNVLAGLATGKTKPGSLILWGIGLVFLALLILICAGGLSSLLGINIGRSMQGAKALAMDEVNTFYEPFSLEAGERFNVGWPSTNGGVSLCQCGSPNKDVKVWEGYELLPGYRAGLVSMHPYGCSAAMQLVSNQLYFVENPAPVRSPPLRFLRSGESWDCGDGHLVRAPA